MHNIFILNEQITLSLQCLEIIVASSICCIKTKKKIQFDLVAVIVGKKILDDEKQQEF